MVVDLVEKEPDLTLEEIRDRLRRERTLKVAVSSIWRSYDRHEMTFIRMSSTRPSRIDAMSPPHVGS